MSKRVKDKEMVAVSFSDNFNWPVPGTRDTVAYKKGWSGKVSKPCADAAIAKGVASIFKVPPNATGKTDGARRKSE